MYSAYEEAYQIGVVFGALIIGAIVGAIPAIAGAVKGKIKYAMAGFVSCVVASLILGLLLAVPVCAVFLYLIFKKENQDEVWDNDRKRIIGSQWGKYCTKCGNNLSESDTFCPRCGSKQN